MRTRDVIKVLLLLAVAAVPLGSALAGELGAEIGVVYARSDYWFIEGGRTTAPHLNVDLGLNAKGTIVSEDVVGYALAAQYLKVSDEVNGASVSSSTGLSYNGNVVVLENAQSPVTLTAHASRSEGEFGAAGTFGRGIANAAGTSLAFRIPDFPSLAVGYDWVRSEDFIPDLPTHVSTTQALHSSIAGGTSAFKLSASYAGMFREGTWAPDNYSTHNVDVNVSAPIGDSVLSLITQSAFTFPSELVTGTFKQQTTSFSSAYTTGAVGEQTQGSYIYGHTVTESTAAPTAEQMSQSLSFGTDYRLTSYSLFTRWSVAGSLGQQRSGDTELRSTGETLSSQLYWRRRSGATYYDVYGGPRVGLLQANGTNRGGYGVSAGSHVSRPVGTYAFQASYGGGFSSNLYAVSGWQLTQSLGASLTGRLGSARVSAALHATAFRTSSPVTGAGAGRSLDASIGAAMNTWGFGAGVALSSGMVGATPSQFVGDGLLLPAPFNSTTATAQANVNYTILPGLSAGLSGALSSSNVPGTPALFALHGMGAIGYRYGAFGVQLTDQVNRNESTLGWTTDNTVMVNAFRAFSW